MISLFPGAIGFQNVTPAVHSQIFPEAAIVSCPKDGFHVGPRQYFRAVSCWRVQGLQD